MAFTDFAYVPMLSVRPSEMTALEETRPAAKDRILPFITLQPWLSAKQFANALARVGAAVGDRPIIADITDEIYGVVGRRPVHDTIDGLRDATDGYRAWFDLIEAHENYIPTLQLGVLAEVPRQIARAIALGRGIVIRLTEPMLPRAADIARLLRGFLDQSQIYFVLDLEKQDRDLLSRGLMIVPIVRSIRSVLPDCIISVSASTFPSSFVGLSRQDIFERQFHNLILSELDEAKTVYCDRGSVRAERQGGGGGAPAPRIDNALAAHWRFYRVDDEEDRDVGYQRAANAAVTCADWRDLGIWGTDVILRTDRGQADAINSAPRSTAVRINIHLHVQAGAPSAASAETEWED